MNDMCAECGADLRKDEAPKSSASVPMIHAIPDLKVSEEVSFIWFQKVFLIKLLFEYFNSE